jgi:hypothetical protein
MIAANSIFDKYRVFRLRQFQEQNYLIGRMSALAISSSAAQVWLLFDGKKSLGEISTLLCFRLGRPFNEVQKEVKSFVDVLVQKGALKFVGEVPVSSAGGEISICESRIPAALLWGGYSN